jgi:hypothetical protein
MFEDARCIAKIYTVVLDIATVLSSSHSKVAFYCITNVCTQSSVFSYMRRYPDKGAGTQREAVSSKVAHLA